MLKEGLIVALIFIFMNWVLVTGETPNAIKNEPHQIEEVITKHSISCTGSVKFSFEKKTPKLPDVVSHTMRTHLLTMLPKSRDACIELLSAMKIPMCTEPAGGLKKKKTSYNLNRNDLVFQVSNIPVEVLESVLNEVCQGPDSLPECTLDILNSVYDYTDEVFPIASRRRNFMRSP